jgi:hydrogenase maturation protease
MKILILGLGNDILGDDAVGILAAREIASRLADRPEIDVVETSMHGVALLEFFIGYDRAIIIDAIHSGKHQPGTIIEIKTSDLKPVISPSPHYAGIPEMFAIAEQLGLEFPSYIQIVALEVEDPYTIGADMTDSVQNALPDLITKVLSMVH